MRPSELAGVDLLSGLPPPELEELAARARPRRHRAGAVLFAEGDHGDCLHVVRSGRLGVVRPSRDPALVLHVHGPGEVFGELAVLNATPRLATVTALEPAETIELGRADLDLVLGRNPATARAVLGAVTLNLTLAREEIASQNQLLEQRVRERTVELHEAQLEVLARLGQAAESRNGETGEHIARVSRLSHRLALACGLEAERAQMLLHAAPMHDIGKIGIPDYILLKPGRLSGSEWEIMKTHTTIGAGLLAGSRSPVIRLARLIALTHHERWNGSGYPGALSGSAIALEAQICGLCDVFDALISVRPYKPAWPVPAAVEAIAQQRDHHFEASLVDNFVALAAELGDELAPAPPPGTGPSASLAAAELFA